MFVLFKLYKNECCRQTYQLHLGTQYNILCKKINAADTSLLTLPLLVKKNQASWNKFTII